MRHENDDTVGAAMYAASLDGLTSLRGRYRPLFELGRGGMSRVFVAESLASGLGKVVVLKALSPHFSFETELRAAFLREATLAAQMNHPNVVQVLEVVDDAETPVIVMEYLDGVSLASVLKQASAELPLPLRLLIFSHLLAGLHHFHELRDVDGVPLSAVHRDVSPQNVIVLHDGLVKVLDFGIAKITSSNSQVTRAGVIKGKIHYMPPEQLLGDETIDRRADIFAVGVMLWETIARRRMWKGTTESALLRNLAAGSVPRLRDFVNGVPEGLLAIVDRATDVDREKRFATAEDMQTALEQTLVEQGWFARPRELADFMQQHFGEARRAQELKLRDALRTAPTFDSLVTEHSGRHSADPITRSVNPGRPPAQRPRVWLLAALGGAIALGGWQVAGRFRTVGHAAHAPKMVSLEIEAMPADATIFLGDERLGSGRFIGLRPASDRKVVLEVRAAGYGTERKELVLRRDMALQIVLKPDAVVPAIAPAPEPSPSATKPAVQLIARPSVPLERAAKAPRAPSSVPNRSSHCRQPYTFGPDGVKTFKTECF